MQQKYEHITKHIYFILEKSVNIKQNGQMQNNQRSLVDRRSLNGLYSIWVQNNTADDIQKHKTVVRESIQ